MSRSDRDLPKGESGLFLLMPQNQKPEAERHEGVVLEAFPALSFRVRLTGDNREILAHLAGKLRLYHIRVLPGDRVAVELSPDGRRGRIVRRL